MAGFLYFLPNHRGPISPATLADFGLSHIVDQGDSTHGCECVANGPGGEKGTTVANLRSFTHEEIRQSDAIEWVKFPKPHAAKQAWLGWYKDRPMPTPADLARKVQLPGETITLADGHKWLVPIARLAEGQCVLPCVFDLDEETGKWQAKDVKKQYAKLWQHANSCYQSIIGSASTRSEDYVLPDYENVVADTLAANYRVSARELSSLGVIDSEIAATIIHVILDYKGLVSLKKSQEQDTGSG